MGELIHAESRFGAERYRQWVCEELMTLTDLVSSGDCSPDGVTYVTGWEPQVHLEVSLSGSHVQISEVEVPATGSWSWTSPDPAETEE